MNRTAADARRLGMHKLAMRRELREQALRVVVVEAVLEVLGKAPMELLAPASRVTNPGEVWFGVGAAYAEFLAALGQVGAIYAEREQ